MRPQYTCSSLYLFMVRPQTKSFVWDLRARQAQHMRKVWSWKHEYMNVCLMLAFVHSNIWRRVACFLILSLGSIHSVHFMLLATILLLGFSRPVDKSNSNHPQMFHHPDRLTHTVCEVCEQYGQDATRGLALRARGYLLCKECRLCALIVASECFRSICSKGLHFIFFLGEHAPTTMQFATHTANHILRPPFPSSISGSTHGNHSCSLTPEAPSALAAMQLWVYWCGTSWLSVWVMWSGC